METAFKWTDECGDVGEIRVGDGSVEIHTGSIDGSSLTPKQARQLAIELIKAADRVESGE